MSKRRSGLADALAAAVADLVIEAVREEIGRRTPTAAPDEYVSIRNAAAYAQVAPGTLRRWIRQRKLEPYGAGRHLRVKRVDLDRLLGEGGRRVRRVEESPEAMADRDLRERFG